MLLVVPRTFRNKMIFWNLFRNPVSDIQENMVTVPKLHSVAFPMAAAVSAVSMQPALSGVPPPGGCTGNGSSLCFYILTAFLFPT